MKTALLRGAPLLLPLVVACGGGDASIALFFPNAEARAAAKRIVVEVYNPNTGATSSERDCQDYKGLARDGKSPSGVPVRGDYKYPFPMDQEALPKVPAGQMIVYVKGFAASDDDAPVTLEGCTDDFDSTGGSDQSVEVPVQLEVVIPASTRLVKSGGDRQVGRASSPLSVPLLAHVEADSPAAGGGPTYRVPGVAVDFASDDPDFALAAGNGRMATLVTNERGEVSIGLQLPAVSKSGKVQARSAQIEAEGKRERASVEFNVTVTQPVRFLPASVIDSSYVPIGLALGRVEGGQGPLDLAVLGCEGTTQTCQRGAAAPLSGPHGQTRLTVVRDVGGSASAEVVSGRLGVLPAAVVFADLEPPAGRQELALLNSRREDCVSRTCPAQGPCACWGVEPGEACACEGSEVLLFSDDAGRMNLRARLPLTASNAVSMAALRSANGAYMNLVAAAQGRTQNLRPCSRSNRCLPYDSLMCLKNPGGCGCTDARRAAGDCDGEVCRPDSPGCICKPDGESGDPCEQRRRPAEAGCPPSERCDCFGEGCQNSQAPGVCVPRDKMLSLVGNRWNTNPGPNCTVSCPPDQVCSQQRCVPRGLFDRQGCQRMRVSCYNYRAAEHSECGCDDVANENTCMDKDGCDCKVPTLTQIGSDDSPTFPFGIAAGPLRSEGDWDVVSGTIGGFERIDQRNGIFAWKDEPLVNTPIHGLLVASVDGVQDDVPDVVWVSRSACTGGDYEKKCPIFRRDIGQTAAGCAGVYYTASASSIYEVDPPDAGGCRRYQLPFAPEGFCTGDFNGDGTLDLAVSGRSTSKLYIMSGDGLGGLLDPPEEAELPGGAVGGPMACGDVDGDGKADVIIADVLQGDIYVLKSGS